MEVAPLKEACNSCYNSINLDLSCNGRKNSPPILEIRFLYNHSLTTIVGFGEVVSC